MTTVHLKTLLLAGMAVFCGAVPISPISAQTASALDLSPIQGGTVTRPSGGSVATVNENNNAQAAAKAGTFANPIPGTIVIHIGGRVHTGFAGIWSSVDQRLATAPAGTFGGPPIAVGAASPSASVAGNNGTGVVKIAPDSIYSYARLYFGVDGMAANGLRYGAGMEIRQNFTGQVSDNSSSGASEFTSAQTLFVRRAFTYVAGDHWGIMRTGQADGIIGLFDNGVTTFQFLPTNNLQNGDDFAAVTPGGVSVPFFFLSGAGNEYGNTKTVYLSPQVAGIDFGIQYAPNTTNGEGIGNTAGGLNFFTGSGTGTGNTCGPVNTGCPTLSSSPGVQDGSRILNQTAVGARYQGATGGVGVLAYAVYEFSGHADYTGGIGAITQINAVAGSRYNGHFDGLSFGNGGLALTYAGFTIGGNIIGGRLNGQLALTPQNAVGEFAYMFGVKYTNGPFVIGVSAERGDYQGNVNLTGLTQRRGQAIDVGGGYTVAPGLIAYAEYQYQTLTQSLFNFVTNGIGSTANNNVRSQGFLLGNVVNFCTAVLDQGDDRHLRSNSNAPDRLCQSQSGKFMKDCRVVAA
jgi:hypothetical protein